MHDIIDKSIGENTYYVHTHTLLYTRMIRIHTHVQCHACIHKINVEHPTPYRANFKVTPNIPTKIEK